MTRWISVVSVLALGAVSALVVLPAGAGRADANCEVTVEDPGDGVLLPLQEPLPARCAELEVTKVVTGEVPPGTTFPVVVDCEAREENGIGGGVGTQQEDLPPGLLPPFTETLTFGEEGGTQSIFIASAAVCTVSEEPPAGCELEGIEPEVTDVDQPEVFPVTVTNSCEVEPAPVDAPPPAPVPAAEARFTG